MFFSASHKQENNVQRRKEECFRRTVWGIKNSLTKAEDEASEAADTE